MMRFAYFGIPELGTRALPDDPGFIWDSAMQYRKLKGQVDKAREGLLGKPNLSLMERVDNTVGDLGAGAGLGLTMLGAKLNQYEPTRKLGGAIKTHGIDTLTSPDLQRMYGLGIPTAGVAAAGIGGKMGYDALNQKEYD